MVRNGGIRRIPGVARECGQLVDVGRVLADFTGCIEEIELEGGSAAVDIGLGGLQALSYPTWTHITYTDSNVHGRLQLPDFITSPFPPPLPPQ